MQRERRLRHFVEDALSVDLDGSLVLKANDPELQRAGLSALPGLLCLR